MSIHNDPRRHSLDEEEYREWQNDLRMEYAQEIYEVQHPYDAYEDFKNPDCDCIGEDGSCYYDYDCIHQRGKWKDMCALWKGE